MTSPQTESAPIVRRPLGFVIAVLMLVAIDASEEDAVLLTQTQ